MAAKFFYAVVEQARASRLMSAEHFTVDGTLIDAWASAKSFKAKEPIDRDPPDDRGNPSVDFHGETRSNDTHASTTDPQARLARKGVGKEAKLAYSAHALMENRHGLMVDFRLDQADGRAERRNALEMLQGVATGRRVTLGADKNYDTRAFVAGCRQLRVTPHVAAHVRRSGGSALDGRTTRSVGYVLSQRLRKRVEEIFGWAKTIGGFRKTRFIGLARTRMAGLMVAATYNLMRVAKLLAAPVPT